jgi:hypothetical protein
MFNRNNILDYVPPQINSISIPSEIINNSLLNLSNIPVVQNDNIVSTQDQPQQQNNNEHNLKKKKKEKVDSDSEEIDTDSEDTTEDEREFDEEQPETSDINRDYSKNKVVKVPIEEDYDRSDISDKMSVYSRRIIGNAMNKKDNETDSKKTINTTTPTLSQYKVFLSNKDISVPNTPSPIEVDKTEKVVVSKFYDDSYYMAIHNKTDYYPADESYIYANGFNDYVYKFTVQKKSRIVKYSIYKQVHNKKLPGFDVIYKMNGSVSTIVESVKELRYGMRDCFENKLDVIFVLIEEEILPDVNVIAPPLQFQYNINKYGDVLFILQGYGKKKNVKYKIHLTEGSEEVYPRQTVTDEEKKQVNGPNIKYRAVRYGLDGIGCNYIIMLINIPNTNNKYTYGFMNIFEIIDQYRVRPGPSGNNEEKDSKAEDMKNIVLDGGKPKKRKHNFETDSYNSIKTTSEFYSDDN